MVRFPRASRLVSILCALACATARGQTPEAGLEDSLPVPESPASTTTTPVPTSTPVSPERATVTLQSVAQKRQQLLVDSLSASAVWLDDAQHLPAFWYPGTSAATRGTMLIVHDPGRYSAWPGLLDNLVLHLSKNGWNLLTVPIPETVRTSRSLNGDTDAERSSETEPAISAEPPIVTADEPLELAYRWLSGRGVTSIVLAGEGHGAEFAWKHLQEQEPPIPIVALVLINSPQPRLIDPADPESAPSVKEIPTLDIFIDDFQWATSNAQMRRRNMLQSGSTYYQQRRLAAVAFTGDQKKESRLTRYVRGFIAKAVESR